MDAWIRAVLYNADRVGNAHYSHYYKVLRSPYTYDTLVDSMLNKLTDLEQDMPSQNEEIQHIHNYHNENSPRMDSADSDQSTGICVPFNVDEANYYDDDAKYKESNISESQNLYGKSHTAESFPCADRLTSSRLSRSADDEQRCWLGLELGFGRIPSLDLEDGESSSAAAERMRTSHFQSAEVIFSTENHEGMDEDLFRFYSVPSPVVPPRDRDLPVLPPPKQRPPKSLLRSAFLIGQPPPDKGQ